MRNSIALTFRLLLYLKLPNPSENNLIIASSGTRGQVLRATIPMNDTMEK